MAVATEQASYTKSGHELETGPEDPKSASTLEEYVGELLSRIQPAAASEDRRETVAQYVQHVIAQAFQPAVEVKAFRYGSVPLKTYLPDGDIDLAIFQSKGTSHQLRATWFTQLSAFLQQESFNQFAPYKVRDVQVIHAEVKLVKCLVDNIVVDISFQSLGGLCTVNFLESIDRRIDNHHLFKRSIILVKAWCYYESRLLGAHHGLISTYALETMVLYIFMVYHKSVTTPLKVLHKFLAVFSKFDWDNQCLSLRGPIPLSTFPSPQPLPFPDMKDPPLLKEDFMSDMRQMYNTAGLSPEATSTTPRAFQLKFLNIMDPLLPTNNLGRSVNKSSFARIRRALDYGAKRLTNILEMEPSTGIDALKGFFQNTWNAQRSQVVPAKGPAHIHLEPSRSNPPAHMLQNLQSSALGGPPGQLNQHSLSLPIGWNSLQGLPSSQSLLQSQHLHQILAQQQQNQALYNQSLHPSVSLDSSHRYMHGTTAGLSQKAAEAARPRSAQAGHDKQSPGSGLSQKPGLTHSASNGKLGSREALLSMSSSQKPQPGRQGGSEQSEQAGTPMNGTRRTNGLVEERGTAMNGGSHREPFHHQPTYPGSLSHMSMYRAVLPGIHQGLHPIVSSLQLGNGYADYFKVPYPFLVQNAAPYNPARYSTGAPSKSALTAWIAAGVIPAHPTSNLSGNSLKAEQWRNGISTPAVQRGDQDDLILAGNLEQLSQQLQSATAMVNSQSAPPTSRAPSGQSHAGENGQATVYHAEATRAPMRSSSMGNLIPNPKPQLNARRARGEVPATPNLSFDASMAQPPNHPSLQQRARYGTRAPVNNHRNFGYDHIYDPRAGYLTDRGVSQPSSPGLRPLPAAPPLAVQNPFSAMGPGEWPILEGKGKMYPDYPESLRWGSQSEGHSGWASPVGSVLSEQSLASLRGASLNGSSPPLPNPAHRGAPLKTTNGHAENATQRENGVAGQNGKSWRENFVLADEDFPGLPISNPQSRTATPTKSNAGALPPSSWKPDSRGTGLSSVPSSKNASEVVR